MSGSLFLGLLQIIHDGTKYDLRRIFRHSHSHSRNPFRDGQEVSSISRSSSYSLHKAEARLETNLGSEHPRAPDPELGGGVQ
jgi:hypothetical protein